MEKKVECKVGDGTTEQVEKTSSKLKINHGDCTTTYGYANDKFSFNGKGMAVNDDSFRVDITGGAESKPAKSEWKVTGTLDVKAKDLGGAKATVNVSLISLLKVVASLRPNFIKASQRARRVKLRAFSKEQSSLRRMN